MMAIDGDDDDDDDDDDENDENTSKPLVREYERNGWADWFITPSLIQFLEISKILWDLKKFEDSQQSRMRQKGLRADPDRHPDQPHQPQLKHLHQCINTSASPSVHHHQCITISASPSVHQLQCTTFSASPSVDHPQCITFSASHSVHYQKCITFSAFIIGYMS